MSKQENEILRYLEESYCGAKMMEDEEYMLRISRAIVAFKSDVTKDIFKEDVLEDIVNN